MGLVTILDAKASIRKGFVFNTIAFYRERTFPMTFVQNNI